MSKRPRPSVKALIVRDGKVLVTENSHVTEFFCLLPGGGQEKGESMTETVVRECLEEISCQVEVGELAFVRDYIGANHEFSGWDADYHQIEVAFWATLLPGQEPSVGGHGDTYQTGVGWYDIDELDDVPLYPAALKQWLRMDPSQRPTYLGDVN